MINPESYFSRIDESHTLNHRAFFLPHNHCYLYWVLFGGEVTKIGITKNILKKADFYLGSNNEVRFSRIHIDDADKLLPLELIKHPTATSAGVEL